MEIQRTRSPVDGRVFVERRLAGAAEIADALERSRSAQRAWRQRPLAERAQAALDLVEAFRTQGDKLADEITWQMGRPRAQSPREVAGFEERARTMVSLAPEALAEIRPAARPGTERFIRREPFGVVLCIAPWNYPLLSVVNLLVPALVAGNSVLLKHSPQTPLCAERLVEAAAAAGLPEGVLQALHMSPEATERLIAGPGPDFVGFTGSVRTGRAVQRAAASRFIGLSLELGGKDPAYVCPDAAFERAVEELVEGSFFNAGQSCCAVERIYVHRSLYERFLEAFVERTRCLQLGNPFDPEVNLGPMVSADAAERVREQIREALAQGARACIDPADFPADAPGTPYLAPQVLVQVHHGMRVMREESFGPVVGIQPVRDDAEAVERMNDSEYGLTASIWTQDPERALAVGDRVETGTWLMNRCDSVDPTLAWTGVKNSGRGVSLSRIGYEWITRPKSYHLRLDL